MMTEKKGKICTHCGAVLWNRRTGQPVKELYDEDLFMKSKILRLLDCKNCCGHHGVVDAYVEQEGVVVLIDLVLQKGQAYRHVLYNSDYVKLILKMALLAIICDGYIDWASLPNAGEFFEQEYLFYAMCGKVALALVSYIGVDDPLPSIPRQRGHVRGWFAHGLLRQILLLGGGSLGTTDSRQRRQQC